MRDKQLEKLVLLHVLKDFSDKFKLEINGNKSIKNCKCFKNMIGNFSDRDTVRNFSVETQNWRYDSA